MTCTLLKISDKVCAMAEVGSHYCSKKSDDICGNICNEVYCGGVETSG
ncbi:hypothetical protein HanRHA438_Chr10g0439941 [Helianthus annuus]|nr:hypothetical protein HanOQP8_Chr10g0355591 [Helianthus annuus]KAJ0878451.1 hypothetical protein HanRHA438_Chr10g0439941 [Helianthus annuus]KAJ0882695.1 hypothetical protein HanPSC8_Chr10g0412661 [Helianthus annuus]